jgi:hypothetical protein
MELRDQTKPINLLKLFSRGDLARGGDNLERP